MSRVNLHMSHPVEKAVSRCRLSVYVYPEFENCCKIAKTGKERHRRKWIWLVLTDEEFTEEESVLDDCF